MKKIIIIFLTLLSKNTLCKSYQEYKKICTDQKMGDERFCNSYASMNWRNDPDNPNN